MHPVSRLAGILFFAALAGCGAPEPEPAKAPAAAPDPGPAAETGALAPELLAALPEKAKALKPGMSPDEVMAALGLAGAGLLGEGGGPEHRLWTRYALGSGRDLVLVFDHSKDPAGRLVSATLEGPGWGSERSE